MDVRPHGKEFKPPPDEQPGGTTTGDNGAAADSGKGGAAAPQQQVILYFFGLRKKTDRKFKYVCAAHSAAQTGCKHTHSVSTLMKLVMVV